MWVAWSRKEKRVLPALGMAYLKEDIVHQIRESKLKGVVARDMPASEAASQISAFKARVKESRKWGPY